MKLSPIMQLREVIPYECFISLRAYRFMAYISITQFTNWKFVRERISFKVFVKYVIKYYMKYVMKYCACDSSIISTNSFGNSLISFVILTGAPEVTFQITR
jgi:hypothetical protein